MSAGQNVFQPSSRLFEVRTTTKSAAVECGGRRRAPPLVLTDPNRQWQKERGTFHTSCWSNLSDINVHYVLDYTVSRKENA